MFVEALYLVRQTRDMARQCEDPSITAFLRRLHRDGEWAYLWTPEGSRSAWYPVGRMLPTLGDDARNVFFGVHPSDRIPETNGRGENASPEQVRARQAHISAVNCLFAEFDVRGPAGDKATLLKHIESIDPAPSVIVDSGGGYHCYWLLAETFHIETEQDRQWIDRLQKGWVARVGGDDGAKDLARMLRLPGTRNHKYVPPRQVRFVRCDLEHALHLSQLAQMAQPTMPRRRRRGRTTPKEAEPTLDTVAQAAQWLIRLAQWRCDEYEPWIEVGMTLSQLGDIGFTLWDLWSRGSAKYESGVCREKWRTFRRGEGLTLGSLAYWAEQDDPAAQQLPRTCCLDRAIGSVPAPEYCATRSTQQEENWAADTLHDGAFLWYTVGDHEATLDEQ